MLDSFDFKEPRCSLCDGKNFYNPQLNLPDGRIPTGRIIEKLNSFFDKDDLSGAKRFLEYWKQEAKELKDKKGELEMESELIGLYRKLNLKEEGLLSAERALSLVYELEQNKTVTGATIILNSATNFKAFGRLEKALPLYQETLKVYLEKLNDNDSLLAGFYNNYALALTENKEYQKAKDCFNKAISILEKENPFNPDIAVSLVNLAHTEYEDSKDKNLITDLLFKAMEVLTNEQTKKDSYLAFVLSKCAPSFEFFGFKKLADDFVKTSKELYERA